jgi:hypothetical protein
MNKLLVLVLVLGLVSMASATPKELKVAVGTGLGVAPGQGDYIDPVDSTVVVYASDLLWIGVYNTTPGGLGDTGQESMFLGISDNAGGEWTGQWAQYSPPSVPNMLPNEYEGVIEGYGDLWLLNMTNGIPIDYMGVGVVDAQEFHCMGIGDVVVGLYDIDGNPVDSFIIHAIPEPATIALLGLGGLLLRRSRR